MKKICIEQVKKIKNIYFNTQDCHEKDLLLFYIRESENLINEKDNECLTERHIEILSKVIAIFDADNKLTKGENIGSTN